MLKRFNKGVSTSIVIIIILVLVVLVGGIIYWRDSESKKEKIFGWQIYGGEEHGFEFKYPDGWTKYDEEEIKPLISSILTSYDGKMGVEVISYASSKNYSLREWAEKLARERWEPDYTPYLNTEHITHEITESSLARKKTVISLTLWGSVPSDFEGQAWSRGRLEKEIFFFCKEMICNMRVSFPKVSRDKYEPVFDQILSTFKFLK